MEKEEEEDEEEEAIIGGPIVRLLTCLINFFPMSKKRKNGDQSSANQPRISLTELHSFPCRFSPGECQLAARQWPLLGH